MRLFKGVGVVFQCPKLNWRSATWRSQTAFCVPCRRSYDKARDADGTIAGLIVWAATRARRFERRAFARQIAKKA